MTNLFTSRVTTSGYLHLPAPINSRAFEKPATDAFTEPCADRQVVTRQCYPSGPIINGSRP